MDASWFSWISKAWVAQKPGDRVSSQNWPPGREDGTKIQPPVNPSRPRPGQAPAQERQSERLTPTGMRSNSPRSSLDAPPRRRYERVLRSRHLIFRTQIHRQMVSSRYLQIRSFTRKAQREFAGILRDARTSGDWVKYGQHLAALSSELESHFEDMEGQMDALMAIDGRLSNLQYHLADQEKDFFESIQFVLQDATLQDVLGFDVLNTAYTSSEASNSERLNPLLEEYYDKAGDIELVTERLAELDAEYQQTLASRRLLAEQDRPSKLPDDQVEREYRKSRLLVEEDLAAAIRAGEEAKAACFNAGLNPDDQDQRASEPSIHLAPRVSNDEDVFTWSPPLDSTMPRSRSKLNAGFTPIARGRSCDSRSCVFRPARGWSKQTAGHELEKRVARPNRHAERHNPSHRGNGTVKLP